MSIELLRKLSNTIDLEKIATSKYEELEEEEGEDLKRIVKKHQKAFLANKISGAGGALAGGTAAGFLAHRIGRSGNYTPVGAGVRGALIGLGLSGAGGIGSLALSHQINKMRNPEYAKDFAEHNKKYTR